MRRGYVAFLVLKTTVFLCYLRVCFFCCWCARNGLNGWVQPGILRGFETQSCPDRKLLHCAPLLLGSDCVPPSFIQEGLRLFNSVSNRLRALRHDPCCCSSRARVCGLFCPHTKRIFCPCARYHHALRSAWQRIKPPETINQDWLRHISR